MSTEPPEWIRDLLSTPRLTPYLRATDGDAHAAIRLYWWNVEVSAAFYGPLQCLEIGLRNALHSQLRGYFGRDDWWSVAPLTADGVHKVKEASEKIGGLNARRHGPDDVVAALTFGFWVSLLSRGAAYDRKLWVPTLHRAFPHYSGRRDTLHDDLVAMLRFRNRVMHHEPVHHRDLAADRSKIYRLLGYLSREAAREVESHDRIPEILARRAGSGATTGPPRF
jgi:hypothetical protein